MTTVLSLTIVLGVSSEKGMLKGSGDSGNPCQHAKLKKNWYSIKGKIQKIKKDTLKQRSNALRKIKDILGGKIWMNLMRNL